MTSLSPKHLAEDILSILETNLCLNYFNAKENYIDGESDSCLSDASSWVESIALNKNNELSEEHAIFEENSLREETELFPLDEEENASMYFLRKLQNNQVCALDTTLSKSRKRIDEVGLDGACIMYLNEAGSYADAVLCNDVTDEVESYEMDQRARSCVRFDDDDVHVESLSQSLHSVIRELSLDLLGRGVDDDDDDPALSQSNPSSTFDDEEVSFSELPNGNESRNNNKRLSFLSTISNSRETLLDYEVDGDRRLQKYGAYESSVASATDTIATVSVYSNSKDDHLVRIQVRAKDDPGLEEDEDVRNCSTQDDRDMTAAKKGGSNINDNDTSKVEREAPIVVKMDTQDSRISTLSTLSSDRDNSNNEESQPDTNKISATPVDTAKNKSESLFYEKDRFTVSQKIHRQTTVPLLGSTGNLSNAVLLAKSQKQRRCHSSLDALGIPEGNLSNAKHRGVEVTMMLTHVKNLPRQQQHLFTRKGTWVMARSHAGPHSCGSNSSRPSLPSIGRPVGGGVLKSINEGRDDDEEPPSERETTDPTQTVTVTQPVVRTLTPQKHTPRRKGRKRFLNLIKQIH